MALYNNLFGYDTALIAQISIPKSQRAIVTERNSIGYSEPSNQSNQVVVLNEGGSGILIKEENNWSLIKFGNGRIAWFYKEEWEEYSALIRIDQPGR